MATVTERKGDVVSAFHNKEFDVFMHQANCQCVFGAGVARQVKVEIPELYDVDQNTKAMTPGDKLGRYTAYSFGGKTDEFPIAVNLYGQLHYGRGARHTNYAALTIALLNACGFILDGVAFSKTVKVCCPKLGCGLGGADWKIVKEILEFCPDQIEFTVFEL